MTSLKRLHLEDAVKQHEALSSGAITSEGLLQLMLDAAIEQRVNCFLYVDIENAKEAAAASDTRRAKSLQLSAVDGLVVAVKDNIDVKGMPTTAGTADALHIANQDADVVASLRRAGVIILGKLNMDEAAVGTSNANPHHGQCLNPNYPKLVPGGSSGGSAAAVAAGFCSMALGTDTMGSIRIPAACCGIVGMKPGRDAVSNVGSIACARNLDTIGPLCRSVRDLALWQPVLAEPKRAARRKAAPPKSDVDQALSFAYIENLSSLRSSSPDHLTDYEASLNKLRHIGHNLTPLRLEEYDFSSTRKAGLIAVEAELSRQFDIENDGVAKRLSAQLLKMLAWYLSQNLELTKQSELRLSEVSDLFNSVLKKHSFLILPTLADDIPRLSEPSPAGFADYTAIANVAGLPAISFPLKNNKPETPATSIQILGRWGSDENLIQVTHYLERSVNETEC